MPCSPRKAPRRSGSRMTTVEVFAPAKINLALHVTGRRADGYHLLDSLVAFADVGDTIAVEPADRLTLRIDGPFARGLATDADNLVLRAARLFGADCGAAIRLTKNLPVASGIGGGSADAAATLRALSELWQVPLPPPKKVLSLGADVPVCLASGLSRMRGIGERVDVLGISPGMGILLVNPLVPVSTPDVFRGLDRRENPRLEEPVLCPPQTVEGFEDWIGWLSRQRNDLEAPAIALQPVIGQVLEELRGLKGCLLARMSGSGATCFALFDQDRHLDGDDFQAAHPDWWAAETEGLPRRFDPLSARWLTAGH